MTSLTTINQFFKGLNVKNIEFKQNVIFNYSDIQSLSMVKTIKFEKITSNEFGLLSYLPNVETLIVEDIANRERK